MLKKKEVIELSRNDLFFIIQLKIAILRWFRHDQPSHNRKLFTMP